VLETFGLLEADYIDTGKVRYIAYPFNLGRPEMALATEAAWCAQDQGDFFGYQHALFEQQGLIAYNQSSLTDLAASIGLDRDAFNQCLSSRTHQADVENARRAAANRGVNATPTFFINNQRVEGNQPYEIFRKMIDQELAISQ
jgi:protein-disulfide isomerase